VAISADWLHIGTVQRRGLRSAGQVGGFGPVVEKNGFNYQYRNLESDATIIHGQSLLLGVTNSARLRHELRAFKSIKGTHADAPICWQKRATRCALRCHVHDLSNSGMAYHMASSDCVHVARLDSCRPASERGSGLTMATSSSEQLQLLLWQTAGL
jgi:hypothetical protein